jgi:putative nucleotidyltransferase with HDIG domain
MSDSIKDLLNNIKDIPTMPHIASEALALIKDPNVNLKHLANVISKDISLTGQILKLVNSAYYGFPSQITTINKAMALLGLNQVNSLVMSVAVKPMLMSNCGKSVWQHSVRCAVASQLISKNLCEKDTEAFFVMGLLHDIGKTLYQIYNSAAAEELEKLVNLGADRIKAESMIFGYTHTDLGEELVKKWNLPPIICNAIKYHHAPNLSKMKREVGIIYVADRITQETLKFPILNPEIMNTLDFQISDPQALREDTFIRSETLLAIMH